MPVLLRLQCQSCGDGQSAAAVRFTKLVSCCATWNRVEQCRKKEQGTMEVTEEAVNERLILKHILYSHMKQIFCLNLPYISDVFHGR